MTDSKEKMIDTILKLGAIASQDSGAFAGEMANASAKIRELMAKYSITEFDLNMRKADKESKEYASMFTDKPASFKFKQTQAWHWRLANIVARATQTRHYRRGNSAYGRQFRFFGAEKNAEIAADLFAEWVVAISHMASVATHENTMALVRKYGAKKKFYSTIPQDEVPKHYRDSWIDGCLAGINEALSEQEREDTKTRSTALVLYKAEIDKHYEIFAKASRMTTVRVGGHSGFNGAAYTEGKKVGKGINITAKKVTSGKPALPKKGSHLVKEMVVTGKKVKGKKVA